VIVSHQHRFIFLKTARTAGTSVEIALSKHCGPEDTITPLAEEDEAIRRRLGYRGPQHFVPPGVVLTPENIRRQGLRSHTPAALAKAVFPRRWEQSLKFTIVRNPWEVCASAYAMFIAHLPPVKRPGFSAFLSSPQFARRPALWREIYTIDGRSAVDEICRYENLAADLERVRLRIGLPEPLELPHAKSGYRTQHYREMMSEADAALIARMFAEEIAEFGYRY